MTQKIQYVIVFIILAVVIIWTVYHLARKKKGGASPCCVEDFRHVFVEVCSIAVKGIALHEGQGAGDHRFQRIPQQRAKHVTVVEQVYSGYLLYLCSM